MKKLLLGITVLGLIGSCSNKELISDCENYKVADKYKKKDFYNKSICWGNKW